MDSYNHMMDPEYGNMMYNSMPNQLTGEGLIMQNPEATKDIQYATTRESIIASSNPAEPLAHYQHEVPTQPEPAAEIPIGNGETKAEYLSNEQTLNEYISPSVDAPDIKDNDPSDEPVTEEIEILPANDEDKGEAEAETNPETEMNVDESKDGQDEGEEEEVDDVKENGEDENEVKSEVEVKQPSEPLETLEIEAVPSAAASKTEATASTVTAEIPTTATGAASTTKKTDDDIDENQCRVCLSKESLINIFTYEKSVRICDIIMTICSSVKILEKDFLPHYICTKCLENLRAAHEFKTTCEATDKDLRLKLKRGKTKLRRPGRYLLIDCEMTSSDEDKTKAKDDDEFHISDAPDSDSDASFTIGKRKKPVTRTRKRNVRGKRGSDVKTPIAQKKEGGRTRTTRNSTRNKSPVAEVIPIHHVFVDAPRIIPAQASAGESEESEEEERKPTPARSSRRGRPPAANSDPSPKSVNKTPASSKTPKVPHKKRAIEEIIDDSTDEDAYKPPKQKRGPRETKDRPCNVCEKVFHSWQQLKEHKKTHKGEKPLMCNICNKPFKQRVSLESHIQKHKEDDTRMCKPCDKLFASRLELRKHQQTVHEEDFTFECDKCKRTFTTKSRLEKHKEGKCPGFDTTVKKKTEHEVTPTLGRDLFKCVAPLTSTYWSDSFSD